MAGATSRSTAPTAFSRYGRRLGFDLLRRGELRLALPFLIKPVSYWRTAEYRAVWETAEFRPSDRVLDVGSPKLLSLYLAERLGAEIFATDIEDYFVAKLRRIRELRRLPEQRLHLQVEDGRQLSFPAGHFDKVYSISVVEHIPDAGDSACLREIGRVLRPDGRAVVTVPFAPESREEYGRGDFYWARSSKTVDGRVFYQRRYSEEDIQRRLVGPSGLRVVELSYIGDRLLAGSAREVADFLPDLTGPLQPLLSRALHTPRTPSWRALAKPLCAVLVLAR